MKTIRQFDEIDIKLLAIIFSLWFIAGAILTMCVMR